MSHALSVCCSPASCFQTGTATRSWQFMRISASYLPLEPLARPRFIKCHSEWGAAELIFIFNPGPADITDRRWEGSLHKLFKNHINPLTLCCGLDSDPTMQRGKINRWFFAYITSHCHTVTEWLWGTAELMLPASGALASCCPRRRLQVWLELVPTISSANIINWQ